ncbi:MHC class II regulatory factor RFX1 isoform X2 [Coregonus clupeaformis]|uniref:MHC class II regulatory factor RFX1 isoform X2 n=1 Tax=Coregonus clupeaformis TaxID=59861 RepID=UPI001E1C6EEC|nr:MHC class II regulatory factor RFX1 isoform X2 [Coregonus clupeaformis]
MATTGYVEELQPVTTQPQGAAGGSVTVAGQSSTSASAAPHTVVAPTQQFLAELQTTVVDPPTAAAAAGQTTPPAQATPTAAQKTAVVQVAPTQGPPPQTQYVTAEIQGSSSQANNAQNIPQYIVVTVTEGSLHSSDSVSDSSSPAAVVQQTGVPTQVVQQVQAAQQRSVVQATSQTTAKTEQGTTQLSVTNLQPVHLTQESSQSKQSERDEADVGRDREVEEEWTTAEQSRTDTQYFAWVPSDRHTDMQTDGHSLQEYPSYIPLSLPLAFPPFALPLSVLSLGWEGMEMGGYPAVTTAQGQPLLFDAASALRVQQQLQQVPVQHVYTNQVQYVEGGDNNYTTSTIRSGSFTYTDTPLYTQTTAAPYYEAPPTSGSQVTTTGTPLTVSVTTGSAGGVSMYVAGTGQIVANPAAAAGGGATVVATGGTANGAGEGAGANGSGGSYVIQGGYMLGGNSQGGYSSHNARSSPATVSITEGEEGSGVPSADKKWLLDNYETAEGVSLPRSTLYCHYLLHCQEQKLEPVNAASFGKLIRSVFMGLRTRRLGTRGNSKYHYYGLRIKACSSLIRLMEDQQHLAMRQQPFSQKQRLKPVQKVEGMTNGMAAGSGQQQQQQQGAGLSDISAQVQQYQQFLDASRTLPEFPDLDLQGKALPEGIELEHIKSFQLLYREHCEAILDVTINLQFTLVETLWKTFWRFEESQSGDTGTLAVHDESEKRLPKECLVILCKYDPVLRWSRDCDNTLYQGLVEILIPDVLRPIPSALTQAIRNFAKSLESWLTNAMMNIPEEMVRIKVTSASSFAQTLRRYTSLNHLAQAARAVLQNTAQINQMLSDLNRVDFANVQEQASWVCRCEDRVVQQLEQDFKLTLQQQNSLEQWAAWLDGVVSQVLKPYHASAAFPKAAKLFLLKWSFYSSMVIRDLTLRSAASFGSFHLIRLLYDEYMYYLIEHRVAQAKGETPIAVMGEFASLGRSLNPLDPDKEEEEEEEEESDDECQELSLPSDGAGLGEESLEPPTKLARTDQRVLFTTGQD